MLDKVALSTQVKTLLNTYKIPGMAIAVVHKGEVVYAQGFGITNAEEGGAPVTAQTLFRIGSVTKPLTGTALMRLVEMGKLDLGVPISQYLPGFQLSAPGAVDQISLRMLLSHSSGLSSAANAFGSRDSEALANTVRDVIAHLDFVAAPGSVYAYSNQGVILAAHIGAVVYGKPYGQMMQDLLFRPLQMNRTTFDPNQAMTYPLALAHHEDKEGNLRVTRPFVDHAGYHPAGFAMTTVLDLARFALLHLNRGRNGQQQLLTEQSIATMQAEQISKYTVDQQGAGLTFFRSTHRGRQMIDHGGGIGNYHASFNMFPAEGAAVMILASRVAPPKVVHGYLIDYILTAMLDPAAAPNPAPNLPADRSRWPNFIGTYVNRLSGLATVAESHGQLTLTYQGETSPLHRCRPDVYFTVDQQSHVRHSVGFPPNPAHLMINGGSLFRFEPDLSFTLSASDLEPYVGIYDATVGEHEVATLTVEDDQLWAIFEWAPKTAVLCTPLNSATRFATSQGIFSLETGPDGRLMLVMNGWRFPKRAEA
jgi:CubicO group peptidase (beta-lactamase class C family)